MKSINRIIREAIINELEDEFDGPDKIYCVVVGTNPDKVDGYIGNGGNPDDYYGDDDLGKIIVAGKVQGGGTPDEIEYDSELGTFAINRDELMGNSDIYASECTLRCFPDVASAKAYQKKFFKNASEDMPKKIFCVITGTRNDGEYDDDNDDYAMPKIGKISLARLNGKTSGLDAGNYEYESEELPGFIINPGDLKSHQECNAYDFTFRCFDNISDAQACSKSIMPNDNGFGRGLGFETLDESINRAITRNLKRIQLI